MSNPWFRLYHEFATDPKIQRLSEADQRRYIMLLCLRCSNGDVTLQDEDVTFMLRISNVEWSDTKARLMERNLINEDNKPTAWDKRQFVSDSSRARVARHRERKKQECNVTVTPPDTEQNRTDTENRGKTKKRFAPPTIQELSEFVKEKGYSVNPIKFFSFYESKNWMVGKNKMKDWRAAVRGWESRDNETRPPDRKEKIL